MDLKKLLQTSELLKARPTKYIRRISNPRGKGYIYFYTKEQVQKYKTTGELPGEKKKSVWDVISGFFRIGDKKAQEKVENDFKEHDISQKFKINYKTYLEHLTEYFTNKEKWDKLFSKFSEPKPAASTGKPKTVADKKEPKKAKSKNGIFRLSVMKFIHSLYGNPPEEPYIDPADSIKKKAGVVEKNFKAFSALGLLNFKGDYVKLKSGGFMPLSIDRLASYEDGSYDIALAHNGELNGDVMADPDMQVRVYPKEGKIEAMTYQNDYAGTYQQVFVEGKANLKLQKELNEFLSQWLKNLKDQGFKYTKDQEQEDNFDTMPESDSQGKAVNSKGVPLEDIPEKPVSEKFPDSQEDKRFTDEKLKPKQKIEIRQQCLDLLATKKDDEMTEEDKALLRQYEGAGGLNEEGKTVQGVLYEFYTPRKVVDKMWQLTEKYAGKGKKKVLEPSAGIGRFAENKEHDFHLIEIDGTSSRIAGILNPGAKVTKGGFEEMFLIKGGRAAQKEYKGEQYDVVIGNPPYGEYSGKFKGIGEGKEHKRYEEYFIDRGLDTLKPGGIMSFIVPSGFLRHNSKLKEQIAAKGKLMEAYRMPNGTFDTTGVGTDILVIRKEPGNIDDFSDKYFDDNPENVLGDITVGTDRWGRPAQHVNLRDDETFDQALNRIKTDGEVPIIGQQSMDEETKEYIDKIDGEEAGVKRPKKITSLVDVEPTDLQRQIMKINQSIMNDVENGGVLRGINFDRTCTLSPALLADPDTGGVPEEFKGLGLDKLHVVKDSPKLKFVFNSAAKTWKKDKTMGQVIYMPQGIKYYSQMVDYLVSQGVPKECIGTIESKTSADAKEKIKASFNDPKGKIKILIGSETIKEGVNLNGNSGVLYNCMLGWNPSERTQVEGRIWRQGNKQGKVHIVYPQVTDSVDSFMYQKHDEKSSRINALWEYKGEDSLNVEAISAEELKFDLIRDPEKRAKLKIDQKKESLLGKIQEYNRNIEVLKKQVTEVQDGVEEQEKYQKWADESTETIAQYEADIAAKEKKLKAYPSKPKGEDDPFASDKESLKDDIDNIKSRIKYEKGEERKYLKAVKEAEEKTEMAKGYLSARGIDADSVLPKIQEMKDEIEKIDSEIKNIDDRFHDYVKEEKDKIIRDQKTVMPVTEAIEDHVDFVFQNLHPFETLEQDTDPNAMLRKEGQLIKARILRPVLYPFLTINFKGKQYKVKKLD